MSGKYIRVKRNGAFWYDTHKFVWTTTTRNKSKQWTKQRIYRPPPAII